MSLILLENVKYKEIAAKLAELDPNQTYTVSIQSFADRQEILARIKARLEAQAYDPLVVGKSEEEIIELINVVIQEMRAGDRPKEDTAKAVDRDGFERSAGAWKGLIDAEKLKRNIYDSRLLSA